MNDNLSTLLPATASVGESQLYWLQTIVSMLESANGTNGYRLIEFDKNTSQVSAYSNNGNVYRIAITQIN